MSNTELTTATRRAKAGSYQQQVMNSLDVGGGVEETASTYDEQKVANRIFSNFLAMSVLFSANHGCVVACLGLATARLGSVGAWQSGLLYLFYTGSALFGATYFVKRLGSRNSLVFGMLLYCFYVGAFWFSAVVPSLAKVGAGVGAAIGGVGAGFIWTAQGSFFAQSAEAHADSLNQSPTVSTTKFASVFAFFYLTLEVGLRIMSTALLEFFHVEWSTIFAIYAAIALASSVLMVLVRVPSTDETSPQNSSDRNIISQDDDSDDESPPASSLYKATVAFQLLRHDRKMRYMIGLNALFGFTSAFLNSFINGQVVQVAFHDDDSKLLGLLTAWVPVVAAIMSIVFGRVSWYKGNVLTLGAVCFAFVVIPLQILPQNRWNPALVFALYTLHGIGRSTFESTLKATFADFFSQEKEGAFANIILQNGLSSALGFVLTFALTCPSSHTRFCVEYEDGSFHNVFFFEWLILTTAGLAIWGYWKAERLYQQGYEPERSIWTMIEG